MSVYRWTDGKGRKCVGVADPKAVEKLAEGGLTAEIVQAEMDRHLTGNSFEVRGPDGRKRIDPRTVEVSHED